MSLVFDGVPETVFFWAPPLGTTTTAGGILTELRIVAQGITLHHTLHSSQIHSHQQPSITQSLLRPFHVLIWKIFREWVSHPAGQPDNNNKAGLWSERRGRQSNNNATMRSKKNTNNAPAPFPRHRENNNNSDPGKVRTTTSARGGRTKHKPASPITSPTPDNNNYNSNLCFLGAGGAEQQQLTHEEEKQKINKQPAPPPRSSDNKNNSDPFF